MIMDHDSVRRRSLLAKFSKFSDRKILIVDREYAAENSSRLIEHVDSQPSSDMIVFDDAVPYVRKYSALELYHTVKSYNLKTPWTIITGDFDYSKSQIPEIVYYPYHAIVAVDWNKDITTEIKKSRSANLSFLSFHMYHVRLLFILTLFKQSWFDTCLLNFPTTHQMQPDQTMAFNEAVEQLTADELATLTRMQTILPLVADPTDHHGHIATKNLGYSNCYINAMVESDYDTPFLTEKSLKPYFSGQFSAVLGNNKIYSHITDLGIDTMQDYLDLSTNAINFGDRVDETVAKISALLPNIEHAWHETYQRRLCNYNYTRSDAFVDRLEINIKQRLS